MRASIAALFAVLLLIVTAPSGAVAATPNPERQGLLDGTVRFLQESQRADGGFAQAGEPSQGTSAWTALALAAAGINPRNQSRPCGADAFAYLGANFRAELGNDAARIATTEFERELLVVNAAGADPRAFAGFDLVAEILARQLADGSFAYLPGGKGQINTTAFAVLALAPVEEPAVAPALERAAGWLLTQQGKDGGWGWGKAMASEVDMTGAVIEALHAAGASGGAAFEAAEQKAFAYLEDTQLPDGGFPALPGTQGESNVASTAWAVQGIWAAGGNPETWRTGSGLASEEPLDFMESMQQPDGHIRWSPSTDLNGIWMTAYVVPAFAGQALPIPEATFSPDSVPPCDQRDHGPESGVVAGGGGKGAPFFSRPKGQSKGETPGGARIVRTEGLRPRNHSTTRRGENQDQPTGTADSEPPSAEAAEVGEVGSGSGGAGSDPGAEGEPGIPLPTSPHEAAADATGAAGADEVSGVVIGDLGSEGEERAFGAPGLRTAGTDGDSGPWTALGIGAAALLLALGGARWERRQEVLT